MARKERVHYANAVYHVMLRGNNKQAVFFQDKDRDVFYERLEDITKKYGCQIHLFCLMTNHIHTVIEVGQIPLSKIMQSLSSVYTRYINKSHCKVGHLFQGRYKAKIVKDEQYLLELVRYIHNNPVNAKLVKDPADYRWSSHNSYSGKSVLRWLTTNFIMKIIDKKYPSSGNQYLEFMQNENHHEAVYCNLDENGELVIINSVQDKLNKAESLNMSHFPFKLIVKTVCVFLNIEEKKLCSESAARNVVFARSLVAYFAHYYGRYEFIFMSIYFERSTLTISHCLHQYLEDAEFKKQIQLLVEIFKKVKI